MRQLGLYQVHSRPEGKMRELLRTGHTRSQNQQHAKDRTFQHGMGWYLHWNATKEKGRDKPCLLRLY